MTTFVGLLSHFHRLTHTHTRTCSHRRKKKKTSLLSSVNPVFMKFVPFALRTLKVLLKCIRWCFQNVLSRSKEHPTNESESQKLGVDLITEMISKVKVRNQKRDELLREVYLFTVARQVGKALILAPLPLAVADVEANRHGAGYPLIAVRRDLHHQRSLFMKKNVRCFNYKNGRWRVVSVKSIKSLKRY